MESFLNFLNCHILAHIPSMYSIYHIYVAWCAICMVYLSQIEIETRAREVHTYPFSYGACSVWNMDHILRYVGDFVDFIMAFYSRLQSKNFYEMFFGSRTFHYKFSSIIFLIRFYEWQLQKTNVEECMLH